MAYTLTDFGSLGGNSPIGAFDCSADGAVIVGSATAANYYNKAFRWTQAGGMVDIGTLGGAEAHAYGCSADGSVVVGHANIASGWTRAFRWTQGGGMVSLGIIGGNTSYGFGTNADGSVVVGQTDTGAGTQAFRWTQAGGMVALGTLGGTYSAARRCSADGSVVVGGAYIPGSDLRAFRWTQGGGMVNLGTLGGTSSHATACSADGSIVVGSAYNASNVYRAFRWTQAGGMVDIGDLGGGSAEANDCSADGNVIVGTSYDAGFQLRAFRWTAAGGMEDFGAANALAGVSDDGLVLVGKYIGAAYWTYESGAPPPPQSHGNTNIIFAPLVAESTAEDTTGSGVVNLRALQAFGSDTAGAYGYADLPALQSEGQYAVMEEPNSGWGVVDLPQLTTVSAGGVNLYGTGVANLPALRSFGLQAAGAYGGADLPALRSSGFDVHAPPTAYLYAFSQPGMSILASFTSGLTSGVAFSEQLDMDRLFALYSTAVFDDRLTPLATFLMALQDDVLLRDAMAFTIDASLSDTLVFGDDNTITADALLSLASALVLTDNIDAHINALLAIASGLVIADQIRLGVDISVISDAEFADILATELDAMMALVSEAQMLDEVSGLLSLIMVASSDARFGDGVEGLMSMLMSLDDDVHVAVRFRTPEGENFVGYIVNIRNAAVSRLTHHNFNSMASIGGKLYGAGEGGIYVTGGNSFDGAPIEALVRTGISDFGSTEIKRMAESYIGYTSDGRLVLKVTTTDGGRKKENWYSLRARTAKSPVEGRFEPARGLTARYWGFEVGNIDGADFQIDDLRVFPMTTIKRRKSGR